MVVLALVSFFNFYIRLFCYFFPSAFLSGAAFTVHGSNHLTLPLRLCLGCDYYIPVECQTMNVVNSYVVEMRDWES